MRFAAIAELLVLLMLLVRGARAEPPARHGTLIESITLLASVDSNLDAELPKFKTLLEKHGYLIDSCQDSLDAVVEFNHVHASPDIPGSFAAGGRRERAIRVQKCRVPDDATEVYKAELTLDVDPFLHNARATLRFIAIGGGEDVSGGYAHRPGEPTSWEDVMDRAIARTLGHYNEDTSIQVKVPAQAVVGEPVELDADRSWDPDGDAFELRWTITTQACVGVRGALPVDGFPCPPNTVLRPWVVQDQAGQGALARLFRIPMVGDYDIRVHAKVGAREESDRAFSIRAVPRRSRTVVYASIGPLAMPTDFLRTEGGHPAAVALRAGMLWRIEHRIGILGWHEELHLGFSVSSVQEVAHYTFTGKGTLTLVGVEAVARELDRTGRWGLSMPLSLMGGGLLADRTDGARPEGAWMATLMAGFYFAFGENYVDRPSALCSQFCPNVTVGPTLTALQNVATSQFGVVGGAAVISGVEFLMSRFAPVWAAVVPLTACVLYQSQGDYVAANCGPKGSARDGDPCLCTSDCASEGAGAICYTEDVTGIPLGLCSHPCATSADCAGGDVCAVSACSPVCKTTSDCGPGRACFNNSPTPAGPSTCFFFCQKPSDCESGNCNPYSGLCLPPGQLPTGGGVSARCAQNSDCRSSVCLGGSCASQCDPMSQRCPDAAICVSGLCYLPCATDGDCKGTALEMCAAVGGRDVCFM